LEAFDVVLLGCECGPNDQTKPNMVPMHDWLDEGGTVIAIHNQNTWFKDGPVDFQSVANWSDGPSSGAKGPFTINNSFAEGQSLVDWLGHVSALNPDNTIPLNPADVASSVLDVNGSTRAWIYDTSVSLGDATSSAGSVKAMSFATPVSIAGPAQPSCGSVVMTDIHPGGGSPSADPVPASCSGDLAAEEKVLEFLLFDHFVCKVAGGPPPPPPSADGG
jgi:hypothetical protein